MNEIERLYFELKEKLSKYIPNCEFENLDRAFNLAIIAHSGQLRQSGEPYVRHPIEVAHILADLELDMDTVIAAILHDVVEDSSNTYDDILEAFGADIALLVEGVTKLSNITYSTKEEQQAENFRKMFLAMAKDVRVVLIKLADRLHNMRTLKSVPEDKQRIKSRETMEVYAPLAHRLGIFRIKWELEDLSLRYLDPIAYNEIGEEIAEKRQERIDVLAEIKSALRTKLDAMGIKGEIEGRAKHFYSIYRKMYTQNLDISQIYDLLAVRVIVDSIADCYAVLGFVHEMYLPIPGRFKDYIAMPKSNMYQSLHTTLVGPNGKPFEVQIRTWEMHRVAEVGIAAHWKYKEGKTGKSDLDDKLEWVRQLIDTHRDMDDAEDFIHSLRVDLFEDEVFVFSPKGDVIDLPLGSTPVDFAYSIHSAIGNRMHGAKVSGRIVPIDYQLQNGDIVEILTSNTSRGPSRDWLNFVKTNQAKKKINEWFKKEHREENIVLGREIIEREIKKAGLPMELMNNTGWQEKACGKYGVSSIDDLYAQLGFGGIAATKLMARIREEYQNNFAPRVARDYIKTTPHKASDESGVIVKDIDNCLVKLARCCNPVPGDDIIGYITRGRGVSVHRRDCVNVHSVTNIDSPEHSRYIEVWWAKKSTAKFITDIQIVGADRDGFVYDVTNIIINGNVPMQAINARGTKDNLAIINITLEISSKEQLDKMIKLFNGIKGVTSVIRTKQ